MGELRPRLGFLGVGWIGRSRMEAVSRAGAAEVAAVADLDPETARDAAAACGCRTVCADLDQLLEHDLDGVVIATPTALHCDQAQRALERGVPVFSQKPLGRSRRECRGVIELARERDLPVGVDMSYRHTEAVRAALAILRAGGIGRPHAADLVFHNAYGPDKPWVRDPQLAGGGALIDLGCHLLDLARLFMGHLQSSSVHADLFAAGARLNGDRSVVEDLALAQVTLDDGRAIRLACSWWLPAGTDAVIEISLIGEGRSLKIRNVDGSFYDFETLLVEGRQAKRIAAPPDDWPGRALIEWSGRLGPRRTFNAEVLGLLPVAGLIDTIYGRPG
jgi:predicted dehydrogenase